MNPTLFPSTLPAGMTPTARFDPHGQQLQHGAPAASAVDGWREVFRVRVYGEPKAQPRARAFAMRGKGGGKPMIRMYDPATAEGWKGCIAQAIRPHLPATPIPAGVGVRVDAVFLFPRPKSLDRKCDPAGRIPHLKKPDRDNLDKALLDCMTTLGLFVDDCQAFKGEIEKWIVAKGERPGAEVTVSVFEQPDSSKGRNE